MTETEQLLRDYVENDSEAAFRRIVESYINLVHSTAIRLVDHNSQAAEDVTQSVFTDLARKASSLPPNVQLGGWLHRHTCFTASTMMRGERRRLAREQQAAEMSVIEREANWNQLEPILDAAINELSEEDRQPIVLRFFEQRDFRQVGEVLGVSDNAAQKRVSRAVEKLRDIVAKRGAALGVAALTAFLTAESIKAAPTGLAPAISNHALSAAKAATAILPKLFSPAPVIIGVVLLGFLAVVGIKIVRTNGRFANHVGNLTNALHSSASVKSASSNAMIHVPVAKIVKPPVTNGSKATESLGTNVLYFHVVAADSGLAVPNPAIEETMHGKKFLRKMIYGDRIGVCTIALPDHVSSLELTTQIEGFADTRLRWDVQHGDRLPTNYVVRLTRPVTIGGRVLGPDNEPVAGASVGWNHMDTASADDALETHSFQWIETKTDGDGRWRLARIAPEMLSTSYGTITHSNYTPGSISSPVGSSKDIESLTNQTHVIRLGPTIAVRGVVVDGQDQPVTGAKILVGQRGMVGSKHATTGDDGRFVVNACPPGKNLVTAEAKGFAPTTTTAEASTAASPITIRLGVGKQLRIRVVDSDGDAVPKATLYLNTFDRSHADPTKSRPMPTQADMTGHTDANGVFVWETAPDEDLEFDITAKNQMRFSGFKVRPDGEEHVAKMAPALIVRGTVRDASTANPVKRFRVICGWPSIQGPEGLSPLWSMFDRDCLTFNNGKFEHVFTDPLVMSDSNPGYVFKFEAEGYAPFVTRFVKPDEKVVDFDVVLSPTQVQMITALLPNGQPAAMADVGWVSPDSRLKIANGEFAKFNQINNSSIRSTDAAGKFRLPNDATVTRVVVVHPEGYGEANVAELSATQMLQLVPWGQLEGTYLSAGKPAADRELMLHLANGSPGTIDYDFERRVKTDSAGRFVFAKLPPGKHQLVYLIRAQTSPTSASFTHQPLQDVEIRAGETTTVTIGGTGYTIKFRVKSAVKGNELIRAFAVLHPPTSLELGQDHAAWAQFSKTPEGEAFQKAFHQFTAAEDHTWVTENVPSGSYVAEWIELEANGTERATKQLHVKTEVTIPENPPTGVIDLGELEPKEEQIQTVAQ